MFLCHVGVTIVSAAPTEGPLLNRLIKYTQMAVTTAEEFAFLRVGRGSSNPFLLVTLRYSTVKQPLYCAAGS